MQITTRISIILCFLFISACSSLKFPGVYHVTVQQGNYIEEEMVQKLTKGQTKEQVRFILGTPMIEDTFNQNRWDYYYNIKRGDKQIETKHFTVHFANNLVTHWEGDYKLSSEQLEKERKDALKRTKKQEEAKL